MLLICKFYNEWRWALIVFTIKALLVAIKNKLHTLQEIQAKNSSATLGILSFMEFQNLLPCSHETIVSKNPLHILTPYIFKILFNITIQSLALQRALFPSDFLISTMHSTYPIHLTCRGLLTLITIHHTTHCYVIQFNTIQYNLFTVHKS